MIYLVRRRGLGLSSVRGIVHYSDGEFNYYRHDRGVPADATGIIRWGCTAQVPEVPTWNKARAINLANDKAGFRRVLTERAPETIPATYFNTQDAQVALEDVSLIVRPRRHAQGRRLWLVSNPQELRRAAQRAGEGFYASKYVQKVGEWRVYVVQGRVPTVARKTPDDPAAIAWNVARGGRFDVCRWDDWPLEGVRKAIEAFNHSGLDFGGVDIMQGDDGQFYVIEINSAPSLPNLTDGRFSYRQECMSKAFRYMVNNEEVPATGNTGNWRDYIHPAIWSR